MSVKGYPIQGRKSDLDSNEDATLFATVIPRGINRSALDVVNGGVYTIALDAAEADSTDNIIKATAHSAKKGDLIRFLVSGVDELEMTVKSVTTNTIILFGNTSIAVAEGDTFYILRPITERFSDTGATLAELSGAMQFNYNGVDTDITEDTTTPANNRPMPVKLVDAGGNILIEVANQHLHVQLTHDTANPDSVQIGNGTNLAGVNASLELTVKDGDVDTLITASNVLLGTIDVDTDAINTATALLATTVAAGNLKVTIADPGTLATEVTLGLLNAKFSSLGIKANAASAPVVLSSEQNTLITRIATAVELIDNAVDGTDLNVKVTDAGTIATQATLATLTAKDFATQTTLAAISAKMPATLGQKNMAASMAVVIASDQTPIKTGGLDVVDFLDTPLLDTSSTNIPASGATPTTFVADSGGGTKEIYELHSINTTGKVIGLYSDPAGTPVLQQILPLTPDYRIPVNIAAGTVLGLRNMENVAITSGLVAINFLG